MVLRASTSFDVPNELERLAVRVYSNDVVAKRDVFLSCILDTPKEQNAEIQNWPRSPSIGLPAKYLREGDAGSLIPLADIVLPSCDDRRLSFELVSKRKRHWDGWAVVLSSSPSNQSIQTTWIRELGEFK